MSARSQYLSLVLFATLAVPTTMTGCAAPDDSLDVTSATLTEYGDTGPVERGWYNYIAGGMSYEAYRPIAENNRFHHLDAMDYSGEQSDLEVGRLYVDGPAVNGRGHLHDGWGGPDGTLQGDFPRPWLDMLVCEGDIFVDPTNCEMADRIELWLEDTGTDAVRVNYRATLPGETEPNVSGQFLAVPGTLHAEWELN